MTAKPKIIVIDTNVWLDFYLPGRAGGEIAAAAIEAAYRQNVIMLYTTAQAKDIFFLAGTNLKALERAKSGSLSPTSVTAINAMCWGILDNMDEFAAIAGSDATDMWLAKKYRGLHSDFEDNLVLAAAERAHADLVVTNDEKLLMHAPVAAVTPRDLLVLLEAFSNERQEGIRAPSSSS